MCGFVGVVAPRADRRFRERVEQAAGLIRHRGPDDGGIFADDRCVLGFRRLSIIDPTDGHQPMVGPDGAALVYNGEVYNFRDLAEQSGPLRTRSDTEVVLAQMRLRGLAALPELDGMFALAHWHPATRKLTLARDRLGVKPLYYAQLDDAFVFASDIRALLALGVPAAPNLSALDAHVSFLWNPGPETAFRGILRLLPGTSLTLDDGKLRVGRYWRMAPSAREPAATVEEVRAAVHADVTRQLVADVPVGVFLSGGVDSSFVASMLPEGLVRRAYTLAFPPEDLAHDIIPDESGYARRIAADKGLELVEVPLAFSADHFLDTVRALEEPVGDPAAVSTRALCAAAEEKVLLSGMGGDELWGGYPRMRALELSRRLPVASQPVARFLQRVLPHAGRIGRAARNLAKLSTGAGLAWGDRHVRYLSYVSPDERRALLVDCPRESPHARLAALRPDAAGDEYDASLRFDLEQFLPCHNLHYTDKASMWESKEVRVPLLGNRMLEVAARFPAAQKRGKAPLKAAARGIVADAVLDRRKAGFGAPVQGWLAGPLRPLVDEYLSATSVRKRGWFRPEAVQRLVTDEREGRTHRYLLIYELLVLETWARTFLGG